MRILWLTLGCASLLLGAIGAVLPVLPTTPFVILAAFAFGKSSPRLRAWLLNSRIFGHLIRDWEAYGSIPTRVKVYACLMMGGVFCLSLYFGAPVLVLVAQGIGIAAGAGYVLTRPAPPRS